MRPPYAFARTFGLLVTGGDDAVAEVAARRDFSPAALAELRRFCRCPVRLELLPDAEFDMQLRRTYEEAAGRLDGADDIGEELDLDHLAGQLAEPQELLESRDEAPVIRLINGLLTQAVREKASDIHIEPFQESLRVRFRVDGILREVLRPHAALGPLFVSRVKVMARLDIAEKRLPQDGRISLKVGGRPVDIRVSTIPSGYGERVVLRLLDKEQGRLDLDGLGMPDQLLGAFRGLLDRGGGIILVTGPTGSGKTTTLYAALNYLNNGRQNILTVEDPIEYYLDGIGQTQVNRKTDMTFARSLRAILRQDPDVVMVGEIRDIETAEVAVQASLTGHLVLSTLHTNTALGAITRLRDMGIEPFLLSSSLLGVLSQRLVRLLCPHCRRPHELSDSQRTEIGLGPGEIFQGHGCPRCSGIGYQGRSGIYELVVLDDVLRSLIHQQASEIEMAQGLPVTWTDLRKAGWNRVLRGETSISEVLRVTAISAGE